MVELVELVHNYLLACSLFDHPQCDISYLVMIKKGLAELEQFHLTRGEYAKRLGITPNAVRMRMRHGNLSVQFRFDGNKYLFKSPKGPRDNIVNDHPTLTTQTKKYNRGNHFKAG